MMPVMLPMRQQALDLRQLIREIPDFPKPGILFRDMGPLLRDPRAWLEVIGQFDELCLSLKPDLIAGIESRGFIVGMALATHSQIGFVPIRKPGKLPGMVHSIEYALEYGQDQLEVSADAFKDSQRVLIIDDLLATGGTAKASSDLVIKAGGRPVGFGFVIELASLMGLQQLPKGVPVKSLIRYD